MHASEIGVRAYDVFEGKVRKCVFKPEQDGRRPIYLHSSLAEVREVWPLRFGNSPHQ